MPKSGLGVKSPRKTQIRDKIKSIIDNEKKEKKETGTSGKANCDL
jgi:hypothetical protein